MNEGIKRLSAMGLGTLLAVAALLGPALSAGAADNPAVDNPAVAVWAPWKGFGLFGGGRPAVERDPTGRLQVFARVPAPPFLIAPDSLWHIRQSGQADPPWQHWENLGGSLQGDPVMGKSYDGRLEVFGRGISGTLQHIAQTDGVNDQWGSWESLDGVSIVGNPAVASNADGRLEMFAAVATSRTEFTLWHIWQNGSPTPPYWSGWENLGGHLLGAPVVGRNRDGRLEVFARAAGNNLAHIWQTGTTDIQWSGWEDLGGGGLVGDPVVGANADGRLEVFTRAADNALWHIWETATVNIGWSSWDLLNGPALAGDPIVGIDLDGRLEVFVRAADTSLWTIRQTGFIGYGWSRWENLQGQLSSDPAVGTNGDGRLELFVLAVDRGVYHMWQQPPVQWVLGSTTPLPMGAGAGIPGNDLGSSVMHNGTLYFFLADGPAPEYSDPIGYLNPTGGAAEGSQGDDFRLDRDASKDFAGFDYLREFRGFSSLYPVPFRLDTVLGPQTLGQDQGAVGAFSYNHTVYVFALARLLPNGVPSNWPNQVPPGVPDGGDPKGQSQTILTSSADPVGPIGPFRQIFSLGVPPSPPARIPLQLTGKFNQVASMVVKNAEIPGVPKTDTPDGLIMLGQGGDGGPPGVSLAWMPLRPNEDPCLYEMRFYKGNTGPHPEKLWTDNAADAKMLFGTRYFWSSISVGRIRGTGRWIVLYQKTLGDFPNEPNHPYAPAGSFPYERHDGIYARISASTHPWDWSPEVKIFDPDRERAWGPIMVDEVGGFAYGAYLLNPYTNWDAASRTVTIQYLMSPGDPYGVVLMRSQIQLND